MIQHRIAILVLVLFTALASMAALRGMLPGSAPASAPEVPTAALARMVAQSGDDPAEVAIGERLFLEARFAQFFFANSNGDANARLASGDPVLKRTVTAAGDQSGSFAGEAMNCRACHLVDEHRSAGKTGNRAYSDFAQRSPIPLRSDGRLTTVRNSPAAVNVTAERRGFVLHFDGEFATTDDLVRETLIGRNYGWLPTERDQAIGHIAHVIREDAGTGELARRFGGPYRVVLLGTAPSIPSRHRLPPDYRIDVDKATDQQIVDAVARLVTAYLESLVFERDSTGAFTGSPYDAFLEMNGLPRSPSPKEPDSSYARRLLAGLEALENPRWVIAGVDTFRLHDQPFTFGPVEFAGLKIFLRRPGSRIDGRTVALGGAGNCVSCHPPPHFTDFRFHNTGAAQSEYDAIHGDSAFATLVIPTLAARDTSFDKWLPPTAGHPNARGPFMAVPSRTHPGHTDLGLWNVVANPDLPGPQAALRELLREPGADDSPSAMLARAIACFKTSGLRDLGHSEPYLHNGRARTLEDVLAVYVEFSGRARSGTMRSPDPEMARVALQKQDVAAVAAFLRSLNEDYE